VRRGRRVRVRDGGRARSLDFACVLGIDVTCKARVFNQPKHLSVGRLVGRSTTTTVWSGLVCVLGIDVTCKARVFNQPKHLSVGRSVGRSTTTTVWSGFVCVLGIDVTCKARVFNQPKHLSVGRRSTPLGSPSNARRHRSTGVARAIASRVSRDGVAVDVRARPSGVVRRVVRWVVRRRADDARRRARDVRGDVRGERARERRRARSRGRRDDVSEAYVYVTLKRARERMEGDVGRKESERGRESERAKRGASGGER